MERIDIKGIAKEANVSATLVSQVLNRRNVRVSEETRNRILEVASRYDYVPNRLAAALKLKKTNTIAIIVPFTSLGFFSELIYHIEARAMDRGYNTLVLNTFGDEGKEASALQFYRSQLADGYLVAAQNSEANKAILRRMNDERVPLAFIDRYVDDIAAPVVSSNHESVARGLTASLLAEGRRNVAFLLRSNEPANTTMRSRLAGYERAMREAGLEPSVVSFEYRGGGKSDLPDRLLTIPRPDGLFVHSGFYMPLTLDACGRLGYGQDMPRLVTVDGFHIAFDYPEAERLFSMLRGKVSVAVQDTEAIAERAVERVLALIDGPCRAEEPNGGPEAIPAGDDSIATKIQEL